MQATDQTPFANVGRLFHSMTQHTTNSFGLTVLDKLERKFGGERFNNPENDAKNNGRPHCYVVQRMETLTLSAAMNQKLSKRIKTILPMVM